MITATDAAGIGQRIRQVRGVASQREFAGRLGISREQLSRIESGAQVPGTETLRRLAQVTRVSLDFVLLGGTSDEPRVAGAEAAEWAPALEPLLGGTSVRLPRLATPASRRADRGWRDLTPERREDVRTLVRRIAMVALTIEALLPAKAAAAVTGELGAALATLVVDRILTAEDRPAS